MVKQAIKKYKNDATLAKVLDYRQMGLKLIANVTFGYTAANYSGRMPLVELGDSIVGMLGIWGGYWRAGVIDAMPNHRGSCAFSVCVSTVLTKSLNLKYFLFLLSSAKSRETLERAIDVVDKTRRWNAQVIYGDTDSMFVLLKGRSTKEAFKIGEEIAEVITKMNPSPVW